MGKKIAFISTHDHHINTNLYKKFQEYFSEYEIEFIDLFKEIKNRKDIIIINTIIVILHYGSQLFLRKKRFIDCFFRTQYIFNRAKKLINKLIPPGEYEFSFQTNSIFDAKPHNTVHFVYTDHTHLTNLTYPSFNKIKIFSDRWIKRETSIYRNSTKVFTYSQNVRNSVINDYGCAPEKVTCIRAGSNLQDESILPLNNHNYTNKNIIFVGIDWERKGGPELLEAFKEI